MAAGFMRTVLIAGTAMSLLFATTHATAELAPNDSAELVRIFEQDQADRKDPTFPLARMLERDSARRQRVLDMLEHGLVRTSNDHYYAAFVFQHGETTEDAKRAYGLAVMARSLSHEPEDEKQLAWVTCATWDRLMMRYECPQWYGTQYVIGDDGERWVLYQFDRSIVSQAEREALMLEPLARVAESFPRVARPAR
ncbi:hypothetical protein BH09PSE6_BH09PSE6_10450 [soil metagenome]